MNKLLQIRREYDEPFVDVVKGFAEMGYSRRFTARVLGFNVVYLIALLNRFGLQRHFRSRRDMLPECKGPGWPKGKPNPRGLRYSDEDIFNEIRRYKNYHDFARKAKMSMSLVEKRFGWKNARRLALR